MGVWQEEKCIEGLRFSQIYGKTATPSENVNALSKNRISSYQHFSSVEAVFDIQALFFTSLAHKVLHSALWIVSSFTLTIQECILYNKMNVASVNSIVLLRVSRYKECTYKTAGSMGVTMNFSSHNTTIQKRTLLLCPRPVNFFNFTTVIQADQFWPRIRPQSLSNSVFHHLSISHVGER